jgi:hypothetical protein
MKQFIYKIVPKCDHEEEDIYIGSTKKKLKDRYTEHRCKYNDWKNGLYNNTRSFVLFDKYGVENCEIVLIEEVENLTPQELRTIEAKYITSLKCVNKNLPNRTRKEYYIDNSEYFRNHNKAYYAANTEYFKAYYKNNLEKFSCDCGGKYTRCHKSSHLKSKKHQNYLNVITTQSF